jgi:BirA family transcriptional regulator, biotin operon repressor / biotin---[acetyl-CoA-carboxylase] ligase
VILRDRVRAELAAGTRFSDIRLLEVTGSTNRDVAELARAGAPEGVVIVADLQTAGRGRLDRTWEAAAGAALLVSVLLRPRGLEASRRHLLTAAAGLAAQEACTAVAGVTPDLKWPNDLLLADGKLAGILAEVVSDAVVVGMGLNVHDGPPGAAVLDAAAGRRVSRGELLAAWLRSLDRLLGDWDAVAALYRERCSTVGRLVVVKGVAGADRRGLATGIDEEGRLLVRDEKGETVALSAGDVTHVRPPEGTW